MIKKASVAGASGYIGKQLVQVLLNLGIEVNVLTRRQSYHLKNVNLFVGDVTDSNHNFSDFFFGTDVFFNCIGENYQENKMYDVHVKGTDNLAKFFENKHWIQLSSIAVYGEINNELVDEDHKKNPKSVYHKTRLLCEDRLIYHSRIKEFKYTILRPSKIIGKESSDESINLLERFISNKLFFYIGPKGASFNYIYDKDVINALIICMKNAKSKNSIYNLSDYLSLEEAVEKIKKIKNLKYYTIRFPMFIIMPIISILNLIPYFPLSMKQVRGLTTRAKFSTKKIEDELGFSITMKIGEVLEKIVKN
tara:strand:- start:10 stop:930 length:921 start_codon:yes stop_codon:yes gene_type:complete